MTEPIEFAQIGRTLKHVLKSRKWTYAELASKIEVSEQTIKRMVKGTDCSLKNLVAICTVLEVSLFEFMKIAGEEQEHITFQLTEEEEQFLVDYPHHHTFFFELKANPDLGTLMNKHQLTEQSAFKYLKKLDEMGFVELREGNKFTFLKKGGLEWQPWGPLAKHYRRKSGQALIESLSTDSENSITRMYSRSETRMTKETIRNLTEELDTVATKYRKIAQREIAIQPQDKLVDVTCFVAVAAPYKYLGATAIPNL